MILLIFLYLYKELIFNNMRELLLIVFVLFSFQVFAQADIVGGEDCSISDYPWQAAIYADGYLCGASVIHQYWVITAAHCVENGNQVADVPLEQFVEQIKIEIEQKVSQPSLVPTQ